MVLECRKLLTDSNIERIAASVSEACEADRDTVAIKRIKTCLLYTSILSVTVKTMIFKTFGKCLPLRWSMQKATQRKAGLP